MPKYFTQDGLEKLKKELEYLKNIKQREIAKDLNYAASFGDLSENAAYHQAKEAQKELIGRIIELENLLKGAKTIKKQQSDEVELGSKVTIESIDGKEIFEIVSTEEADFKTNKISSESPLGKTLLGKKMGDKTYVSSQEGKIAYKIIKVE